VLFSTKKKKEEEEMEKEEREGRVVGHNFNITNGINEGISF